MYILIPRFPRGCQSFWRVIGVYNPQTTISQLQEVAALLLDVDLAQNFLLGIQLMTGYYAVEFEYLSRQGSSVA